MMTVNEVSKKTGVSIRTLHYYDEIGLLKPNSVTEAGYRMYSDEDLSCLSDILFFKEMGFPLKQIAEIIQNPNYDRKKAIKNQVQILKMQKEHLEDLISFAIEKSEKGGNLMDFSIFDKSKMKEYAEKAKEEWGETEAYQEYEEKTKDYSDKKVDDLGQYLMSIFKKFGDILRISGPAADPGSPKAQAIVKELQAFITANYYTCTKQILANLGQMYAAEGEMKANIDRTAGRGSADFAAKAIQIYCK